MQYRKDRYGNDLSMLGYGCMRFTRKGTGFDAAKAEAELMTAYRAGVNYFDTAYVYPGSEALVGEIFERNGIRDKVRIATKLPQYLIKRTEDFDKYFNEELRRLRTDYIDYYLMHMMNDVNAWTRLQALGIEEWIASKKACGQIRQIGFSYHGNSDAFSKLLDAYDWDFCQIQYNYLDEHSQAGRTGLDYAHAKGLPVIIMEPLRGGKLVHHLPKEAEAEIRKYNKNHGIERSAAEWGLRWLYDQPEVTVVLSGMNSVDMVEENCRIADEATAGCYTEEEREAIGRIRDAINSKTKVPCTGCRYCMPCPHGVDIPGTFSAYNHRYTDGFIQGQQEYLMCTAMRKENTAASNCIGCGLCERHCPQHIAIRDELKNARRVLEGPAYKIAKAVLPLIWKY